MDRFYGMSMESFLTKGYGWVVKAVSINFKRPLTLGETFTVRTGIKHIDENGCSINFEVLNKATKTSADGWFEFVMTDLKTGKGMKIPADIIRHYAV